MRNSSDLKQIELEKKYEEKNEYRSVRKVTENK
jgi:hypothetical protein